ncbi:MAG: MG2 domain-containing protein [Phycisphaeraceae bacterium]
MTAPNATTPRPARPTHTPRPTRRPAGARALLYALLAAVAFAAVGPMTGLYAQAEPAKPAPDQPAQEPAEPEKPAEPTLTDTLGGDDRYLTHLATDKPIYRAGETVYVRGTILHAFTQQPFDPNANADEPRRGWNISPMIEIKDPKGVTLTGGQARLEDSVFGFSWQVPDGQAGGEYTIKVTHPWSGLAPAERPFDIRAYRAPRIRSQIDFVRDGYGPGDTVTATLEATRAEGGVPEGAKITAIARIDGREAARVETTMGPSGVAEVSFDLPEKIERGEGSLAFVIQDGGVVETASKTLPILLQTLDLNLYPEGGDLVAGVENRVYFEARTPYGKPADIKGMVIERAAEGTDPVFPTLTTFETRHEGRGSFTFTPKPDRSYSIVITEPASVKQTFDLPATGSGSVALHFDQTVIDFDEALRFKVSHSVGQPDDVDFASALIQVRQREVVVAEGPVLFTANGFVDIDIVPAAANAKQPAKDVLELPDTATGVLTVTAYDAEGKPLAERLIYRAPKHQVNIAILPDSARYTPAGQVQLTILTTDENGQPVPAVAGLTVTDDAVLEMIETREQAPMLPAMVFLEQEVDDLADAHVYLDPNNPDAAQQLDLLLGTQGWRRFALVNVEDFILAHGDDARRVLALRVPVMRERERAVRKLNAVENEAVDFALADGVPVPRAAQAGAANDPNAPGEGAGGGDDKAADEPGRDLQQALEEAAKAQEQAELIAPADDVAGDVAFARRAAPQMVYVREYAHKQPEGKPFGTRSDFTETVYWSAATKTGEDGTATVTFDLSDSVTSFRVKADAFTAKGALGASTQLIESVRPFYVEPKLPLELTAGDVVQLPIAMVNNTNQQLPVELIVSKLGKAGTVELDKIALAADTRGRTLYELTVGETYGNLAFNIEARAGSGGGAMFDQNNRRLRVVPRGFPIKDGSGGMLQPDSEVEDEITIPETVIPGSLSASVTVYPTPMANLTEALEALIRDPYGCFEQTSSTTFPLVMAQQYFLSHQGIDPALIAKSREKLDAGYKRLISFETEKNGYEWFGSTPPHEALTAYGLLQFNEMKQVMDVDQAMIDRTADWLMSRRDGKGSFKLDSKALDSFGRAPQETTNAYIVWSMLEAGYDPAKIEKEIDHVLKQANEGDDAYIVALGANVAALAGRDEAGALTKKLAGKLTDEGYVDGAVTSITRSGGDALRIETTSLAILAWLRDDAYTGQVEKSILWLTERCKAGRFGSTQSTVLALKAIVEYDKARSTPKAPGSLILLVDGEPFGEPVAFNEETKGAIKLPDLAGKLTPGKHTIGVLMDGGSKMPYTIAVDYYANTPASSEACKLRVQTGIAPLQEGDTVGPEGYVIVPEGETTEINVKVTNVSKDGLPTPIAIVGIPGGLEPSYDQLKELVEAGTIASFEVIGREVVLYWREMKGEQVVELPIRCVAAVPGTYTGPASRAYLYYTDEDKQWVDGLSVTITPAP